MSYLIKSVNKLVGEYNEYIEFEDESNTQFIDPQILGVVFTMIEINRGAPISSQRPYISQTEKLGFPTFTSKLRDNKNIYAEAPQYGVPVVLNAYSSSTHKEIVQELKDFAGQFITKSGILKNE